MKNFPPKPDIRERIAMDFAYCVTWARRCKEEARIARVMNPERVEGWRNMARDYGLAARNLYSILYPAQAQQPKLRVVE